ncbi:MAG: serine/threonine protein kinase [Cyanophyceae cyanobacterium]
MKQILSDRYEILQPLSNKGGRQTFLARELKTQSPAGGLSGGCFEQAQTLVVLKLLKFGQDFEWEHLKLFEREAKILQNLSHPAIPRYLDSFELDLPHCQGFALVQTYIEAKSLEEHLKNGRTFSEAEVKQLAQALLEILIYLHGRSPAIVHRDLKPSNILLTSRSGHQVGQVYLVDFGSVQSLVATEGGTMTVVGTYGYMPPEQFGGRAVPASDLYSLGATLIYLVTGAHPADLPHHNLQIQFRDRVSLHPSLVSWIERLTKPTVEERFNTAAQALEALEQLSSGLVPSVRHGTLSGREQIRPTLTLAKKSNHELEIRFANEINTNNKSHPEIRNRHLKSYPEIKNRRRTSKASLTIYLIYFVGWLAVVMVGFAAKLTLAAFGSLGITLVTTLFIILFFILVLHNRQFYSLYFNKNRNFFKIVHRSLLAYDCESACISDIRYISIVETARPYTTAVNRATFNRQEYCRYRVTIRANKSYSLKIMLSEEECLWLVNKIQTWLKYGELAL